MTEPTPTPTGASPARIASIVVGVDDSPESLYALDLAAAIGAATRAAITVVHVRPRPASLAFSPAASIEYEQAEVALDEAITTAVTSRLTGYSGEWRVAVRSGHVGTQLLAAADDADADLVVVGHRSHGPVRDAILGSVAASTVHHSRRSVLVAVPPA